MCDPAPPRAASRRCNEGHGDYSSVQARHALCGVGHTACPEWHRKRHLNSNEWHRHLKSRNWKDAEGHLAAALVERKHSAKNQIELLIGLATAQREQGNMTAAEQTIRTALDLSQSINDHEHQMQALEGLSEVQLAQQNYSGARESVERIVSAEGAQRAPNNVRMAAASRKIATVLVNQSQNQGALEALDRAAKFAEQGFGPGHVETAGYLAELGALHKSQGNHEQAQICLRRGLAIYATAQQLDSHVATRSLFELANSLIASGDPDAACREFERMLTIKERQIGGNPAETAEAQLNLASLYLHVGRDAAARELLLIAVRNLERDSGGRLVRALELLIEVEESAGRGTEARKWQEKLAAIQPAPAASGSVL